MPELGGMRPAALQEPRPQMVYERHSGSGFKLVLDVTVPQMGRELVEVPNVVSQVVEQNVDIPVRRGRGRSKIPHGGLHGLRPGQGLPALSSAPVVEYFAPAPVVIPPPVPVIEYFSPAPAVFQAPAPVVQFTAPAPAVVSAAPVVEYIAPAPAVVVEHVAPTPAVSEAPAPVTEYIAPAPAVVLATPVVEQIAPAPAVSEAPAPVTGHFLPTPAVFPAPAPMVEFIAPAPAVSEAPAPVTEYFLPAPAVFQAPAPMLEFIAPSPVDSLSPVPVEEYRSPVPAVSHSPMPISPAPAVSCASASVVDSGLPPWRRGIQGPVPPLVAELFALGELPRRTPREAARMREILAVLDGPREWVTRTLRSLRFSLSTLAWKSIARIVLVPTARCYTQLPSCSTRKASFVFLFPWYFLGLDRARRGSTTGAVVRTVQNSGVVVQFLDKVVRCPFLQRQEPWSRQCSSPDFVQFLDKVMDVPV